MEKQAFRRHIAPDTGVRKRIVIQDSEGDTFRRRRRAKVACTPCRQRKRKCDGQQPCTTCVQFEYDCCYTRSERGRRSSMTETRLQSHHGSSQSPITAAPVDDSDIRDDEDDVDESHSDGRVSEKGVPFSDARAHLKSLEANSGAAFVRKLGLKLDASTTPQLRLFAWNTGERLAGQPPGTPRPITSILSQSQMIALAQIYFKKVVVTYDFIDQGDFFRRLDERWLAAAATPVNLYDQVFCGVAALGLHFSEPSPPPFEVDLVESAKSLLQSNSLENPPSIETVTGWVLRVAYLRMTSTPHATWLESCTMMHVIEAARVHQEEPLRIVLDESPQAIDVDIRRRLFGMAQHFNIWASFDLGRTNVTLSAVSTKPVSPKQGNYTSQMLALIPLTESLNPNKTRSVQELETDFIQLAQHIPTEPPLVMAQTNLMLCLFRRLRAQKSTIIAHSMGSILELAAESLRAARRMVSEYCPWHHSANIPFQVICLLLVVDNKASLELLPEALSALKLVRDTFNSAGLREAYDTAYLFILLYQRRKEEDAKALANILNVHANAPQEATATPSGLGSMSTTLAQQGIDMPLGWELDGLITDVPGLREFDLEQFLIQDAMMP